MDTQVDEWMVAWIDKQTDRLREQRSLLGDGEAEGEEDVYLVTRKDLSWA